MAKRKSTKKSTSSRKKTSSRKTSSKSRALPQGYTRAAYSSKLALDALIKKGFISKSATLTEMLAYPQGGKGSKTAAVNELIESYSIEYPSLFGKGSAHQALAEHYSKSKSGSSLNKLIDRLIEEGKIVPQEGVYKEQDNPLLRSLKGLKPQMAIGQQTIVDSALMRPAYSNILTDNPTNFKRFAEPFLRKDAKGNIQWSSVDALIKGDDTAPTAGPARLAMTRLWQVVKGEVLGLEASYRFQNNDTAQLTENQKARLENLKNNIGSLVSMFGGVDITAVSDGIEKQTPVPQTPGTFTKTVGTVDLGTLASMTTNTVKQAKDFLTKAKIFASSKGNFLAVWRQVSNELAAKQSNYNRTLLNNVIQNIDIVPQETIITLLRTIAQDIGKARAEGTLDSRDYAKYERRFNELIRGAKSIPTMAKLVELAGSSNDPRVSNTLATKKYAYDILVKKIQKFKEDIESIGALKGLIDRLKTGGTTKKQFVERLQSALDRANDMSKLTEKQKNDILNNVSGALATKEEYQKAIKAVQKLRITLQRVRSARTEQQARTEVAYLTLGIGTDFTETDLKAGIETAFKLGDAAIAKDFTSAVKEQKAALTSVQNAAYQDKQYMAMFFVDPMNSINLKPFSALGTDKKLEMNTVAQATTMTNNSLGNISACRIQVPDTNDPREVLKRLPSSIRSMGNDQVKARANAATRFLSELSMKHRNVIGLLKNLYSGTPNQNAQNLYEANLTDLKQTLNGVNYDKGLRQNASVGSKGFHVCALTTASMYTAATNAPKAILKHGDLVWFPVFRGDTLYPNADAQRSKEFSIGVDAQGNPVKYKRQNDEGILTRRFGVNNLGQEFTYKWNPVDAEMLRVRYFVSLYPFSLTNSRFNQIYREELADIKQLPKPGITGASRQQASDFILGLFS